ncbi:NADP-dependent oxidoreductase [Corynebacterium lubricantis]|uniref:NADP-dependent oxidoreductase n=1 Tax=Corynebacterium lubricantis TaxID=541095 RepID=UPI0003774BF9|nr:NADP-dependent oxidoreductase [Corynebacterium lubricantis]
MTAAQFTEYGSTDNIVLNNTPELGEPAEGQVLVQVSATSINAIDNAIIAGYLAEMLPLELPATVGGDFSGTVVKVGAGVDLLSVGDRVIGQAGLLLGGAGSFADQILAPAALTALAPTELDLNDSATLPLVGASAIQALRTIGVSEGSTIVVLGAGGGIGSVAVQAAKAKGARVIASASASDIDYVKGLGADEVHIYQEASWADSLPEVDGVFDTAPAGVDPAPFYKALKKGGHMVSMGGTQHNEEAAAAAGIEVSAQMTQPSTDVLNELVSLVNAGKISQRITNTFPLSQTKEAFAANAESKGKTLVVVGA